MPNSEPLLPKRGGYRKLKSFQLAQLIYDLILIGVATILLSRQIAAQAAAFERKKAALPNGCTSTAKTDVNEMVRNINNKIATKLLNLELSDLIII